MISVYLSYLVKEQKDGIAAAIWKLLVVSYPWTLFKELCEFYNSVGKVKHSVSKAEKPHPYGLGNNNSFLRIYLVLSFISLSVSHQVIPGLLLSPVKLWNSDPNPIP